jgi:pseudouridine-5'-phosphate glycosidase/pseudouridine kinase
MLIHPGKITKTEAEHTLPTASSKSLESAKLIVIGSAAVDITSRARPASSGSDDGKNSTLPGSVSVSLGGVARNISEAAYRTLTAKAPELGHITALVSCVGNDLFGHLLVGEMQRIGMRTDGLVAGTGRTAVCNLVLDDAGDLVGGVADMDIVRELADEVLIPLEIRVRSHFDAGFGANS